MSLIHERLKDLADKYMFEWGIEPTDETYLQFYKLMQALAQTDPTLQPNSSLFMDAINGEITRLTLKENDQ